MSDPRAAEAAAFSDMIITAVDDDVARVQATIIAQRYHRAHLDMAAGTAYTGTRGVAIGGEIRLNLPNSTVRGCAACFGGVDWSRVMREINAPADAVWQHRVNTNWLRQRPGSSASAIHSVLGRGARLLDRLLQGHQRDSIWLHHVADGPRSDWDDLSDRSAHQDCLLCTSDLAGLGDPAS